MKPTAQTSKGGTPTSKSKKSSKDKDREKRKSQGGDCNNYNSKKSSPTKEANTRLYAGIDEDSLSIYAEQAGMEHLPNDVTNALTEDINYRLRYIINESLIKARLSGRNAISSSDLEQTFENLKIDRVYGAPSQPNWVPFGYQNLYYLDDNVVNLVEIAEATNTYYQYKKAVITTKWLPMKDVSKPLKNYFTTMCQIIVNPDIEIRRKALKNIAENARIGPIIEWFYNFGYILLSKDITYDNLTLRALDLISTLENSQICRISVSEKQLKLLVRLILQRLLKSPTSCLVLKSLCQALSVLCQRHPLREFVIVKICQKFREIFNSRALEIVAIANHLGVDAVSSFVLPNLDLFLHKILLKHEPQLTHSLQKSYNILVKSNLIDSTIYERFYEVFGEALIVFNSPPVSREIAVKKEINFAHVKYELMKTRRKICPKLKLSIAPSIEEVFEIPAASQKWRKKLEEGTVEGRECADTDIIIGQTSLLLPIFKQKILKTKVKCHDHTLVFYNV